MKLQSLKKYLFYALSILFGRGLEYIVFLVLAASMSVSEYGELEYYKRFIELGAVFTGVSIPVLFQIKIRTTQERQADLLWQMVFTLGLVIVMSVLGVGYLPITLIVSTYYFANFHFSSSALQSYYVVEKGGGAAASFKIFVSICYGIGVLSAYFFFKKGSMSQVYGSLLLSPFMLVLALYELRGAAWFDSLKLGLKQFKRDFKERLVLSAEGFLNIGFLISDVLIIEHFSQRYDWVGAYGFLLMITSALLIVPLSLIQVDIEKLKQDVSQIRNLYPKFLGLLVLSTLCLVALYFGLLRFGYSEYSVAMEVVILLFLARFFHAASLLKGTFCLVKGGYKYVILVAIFVFVGNVVMSIALIKTLGITGVALSTLTFLFLRWLSFELWWKRKI